MDRLAYRIDAAAEAAGVSADIVRKALRTTDPTAWPPPLRARRVGVAVNAPHLILADDLREWLESFPEAS